MSASRNQSALDCIPLARVSVTAAMLESFASATDPPLVGSPDARFWRKALAPDSNPSAMMAGRVEALSLTVDATFFTRSLIPAYSDSGTFDDESVFSLIPALSLLSMETPPAVVEP